nr:DUF4225 domain-containing protein [Pantoea agglomerans]
MHASVQFVQQGDIWGYVINGVGVVLNGLQEVAGFGVMAASAATGNIIGVWCNAHTSWCEWGPGGRDESYYRKK